MKSISRDVVIIGAGISGSSTAIYLTRHGIKPLIVDEALFPRETVGEGLSPAVGGYLKDLGVLDDIVASEYVQKKVSFQLVSPLGHTAYTKVDFTKKHYKDGLHDFPFGFNVRRKYFDYIFFNKAKSLGAEIWEETRVTNLRQEQDCISGIFVEKKNGEKIDIQEDKFSRRFFSVGYFELSSGT